MEKIIKHQNFAGDHAIRIITLIILRLCIIKYIILRSVEFQSTRCMASDFVGKNTEQVSVFVFYNRLYLSRLGKLQGDEERDKGKKNTSCNQGTFSFDHNLREIQPMCTEYAA